MLFLLIIILIEYKQTFERVLGLNFSQGRDLWVDSLAVELANVSGCLVGKVGGHLCWVHYLTSSGVSVCNMCLGISLFFTLGSSKTAHS